MNKFFPQFGKVMFSMIKAFVSCPKSFETPRSIFRLQKLLTGKSDGVSFSSQWIFRKTFALLLIEKRCTFFNYYRDEHG